MRHLFVEPERFSEIDSTNRYLVDRARQGAPEGSVAIADVQSAGRGRQGRTWIAEPGTSLLCSLLFRPQGSIDDLHLIPTLVALAALHAIEQIGGVTVSLKWPNDLLVGERKVAGMLSELTMVGGVAVVVGIGINLFWPEGFPPTEGDPELVELADRATTLERESGRRIDRPLLTEALLDAVEARYDLFTEQGYAEELRTDYRANCSTIGRPVRVEMQGETFEGEAVGVAPSGRLLVQSNGLLRELDAAEVVHIRTTGP